MAPCGCGLPGTPTSVLRGRGTVGTVAGTRLVPSLVVRTMAGTAHSGVVRRIGIDPCEIGPLIDRCRVRSFASLTPFRASSFTSHLAVKTRVLVQSARKEPAREGRWLHDLPDPRVTDTGAICNSSIRVPGFMCRSNRSYVLSVRRCEELLCFCYLGENVSGHVNHDTTITGCYRPAAPPWTRHLRTRRRVTSFYERQDA